VGVAWKMRPDLTLLAVVNLDSVLFDVFPAPLRDRAHAGLVLGADAEIAGHMSNNEDQYSAEGKNQVFVFLRSLSAQDRF